MEKFEVHILGCGSALPTLRHSPSSQVVSLRNRHFMIDCGEGAQLQLKRSHLNFQRLSNIFISHLHGDHCFGLPGLISSFALLGMTNDIHIYSPVGLEKILRPWLNFFCKGIKFNVLIHELPADACGVIYEDNIFTISAFPLQHRIPTIGYRFNEKPSLPHIKRDMISFLNIPYYAINAIKGGEGWTDAEGRFWPHERLVEPADLPRSYAYCSDTAYHPGLAEHVKGVSVLYHEATFANADKNRAAETFHSTAAQAAQVAKSGEVGTLLLGHYSSRYRDESAILEEAKAIFPRTLLTKEQMCFNVE